MLASTLLCATLCAAAALGASALRQYDRGTNLTDRAALSWTLNDTAAQLGVVVTDGAVVQAGAGALWLGLGLGDPYSGGMLGADIVTAEFDGEGGCALVDRHVKGVGYPLGESEGGDAVWPEEDSCAEGSWVLSACRVDVDAGVLELEVDRALAAGNVAEDRDISPGVNVVMVAYGDGFGYHGANRVSVDVDFGRDGAAAVGGTGLEAEGRVPADAVASQVLRVSGYEVPASATTYMCESFVVDLPAGGGPRQIVAAEAVVDGASESGRMVHHFVVRSCRPSDDFDSLVGTPSACRAMNCTAVVYLWAKGGPPLVYPDITGLPVDEEERYYQMQVHYDNPEGKTGVVDTSAVRLYFTDTPRETDAAIINIGDPFTTMVGPVQDGVNYSIVCPSECTSQLTEPLTVFASYLHAHLSARQLWTNQFRDGEFLRTIEGTAFWSNDNQGITLREEVDLLPGDELVLSGNYDLGKRAAKGETVVFDLATEDEMFMSFLLVYPRPVKKNGVLLSNCGFLNSPFGNITICTDGLGQEIGVDFLTRNPLSFNTDTIGPSEPFGLPATCGADRGPESDASPAPVEPPAPDRRACFPADATVELDSGDIKRMDELTVGDKVLVAHQTYSDVFMFTHADAAAMASFVDIRTGGGMVSVTPGHYVPLEGRGLVRAGDVRPGDMLREQSGALVRVNSVYLTQRQGLFNPQTLHGHIVVNGLELSTYTTAVHPAVAHAALSPLRFVFYCADFVSRMAERIIGKCGVVFACDFGTWSQVYASLWNSVQTMKLRSI